MPPRLVLLAALLGFGRATAAPAVSVAAAANLTYVVEALNAEFRRSAPDTTITVTLGASGSLFAQIRHGAPFDLFLSADTQYPAELARSGDGDRATLSTFAVGRLVFWTTQPNVSIDDLAAAIRADAVRKIAIANPQSAPYGRAAVAALRQLGLWDAARPKVVVGENIAQTAQFVDTGNADAGFVAKSLVLSPRLTARGRWSEVPAALYADVSLAHACILTKQGAANAAARSYLAFLQSAAARRILAAHGYDAP